MDKLINSIPFVTAKLLKQKGDFASLYADRADTRGKLNQLPVSTAENLSAIERQFYRDIDPAYKPPRREALR
jgi:hypothetical protein